jgi:hypothetical protein
MHLLLLRLVVVLVLVWEPSSIATTTATMATMATTRL